MTYAQLDAEVSKLAAHLRAVGLSGQRALLLYGSEPACLIAIFACLSAGVVAVPLSLPRPNRSGTHLEQVARDAQPSAALTTVDVLRRLGQAIEPVMHRLGIQLLATDALEPTPSDCSPSVVDAGSIAYLQYTSGSTSDPKGVVITHGNVDHNCRALAEVVGACEHHVGVGWLPFFHDMGLVGTIFLPLMMGFPIVFMPPEAFIMKPIRWLRAISRFRATISPAPNFAYDLCTQRVTPEHRADLDLSSWAFAFNGAERVDPGTLDRFSAAFAPNGFRPTAFVPCYGLAESTLFVTGRNPRRAPVVRSFQCAALAAGEARLVDAGIPLVSCGQPAKELELAIVDPTTRRHCADGRVGEIWIWGPSVAAGYWNHAQATDESFQARLANADDKPFLRTGDLGFVWEGDLFITGRLKDLIIIGGRNIAPEDIERSVETAHPAIGMSGAIAFSVDGNSKERLIVVAEVSRHHWRQSAGGPIEHAIRDAVAKQDDVAVDEIVLVKRCSLPKTLNGKKMRSACRQAFLIGTIRGRFENEDDATR